MNNNASLAAFLKPEEIQVIQAHLMQMLSEEIPKYTHDQSSSVPVETAQTLFESMLYCITAYLNTLPDAADALRSRDLEELFRCGLDLVKQYIEECKSLLLKVKATRVQTDLIAYNQAIDLYFREFFKSYNPRFEAQNNFMTIDYPLLKNDTSITGILYIRNYLTQLLKENEFCAKFSQNHIRSLLLTHGVKHHLDYRDMLINITELLLEQSKNTL